MNLKHLPAICQEVYHDIDKVICRRQQRSIQYVHLNITVFVSSKNWGFEVALTFCMTYRPIKSMYIRFQLILVSFFSLWIVCPAAEMIKTDRP